MPIFSEASAKQVQIFTIPTPVLGKLPGYPEPLVTKMYRRELTRISVKLEDIQEFQENSNLEESNSTTSNSNGSNNNNGGNSNGTTSVNGSSSKTTQTRQSRIGFSR